MSLRDSRTGEKLPPPISQEIYEMVMDTAKWVRQSVRDEADVACSSILLVGTDAETRRIYAEGVAEALGTKACRLSVLKCLGRSGELEQALAELASRGGVVVLDGLHHLSGDRYHRLRDDLIEMLRIQTMEAKPFVIVGSGDHGIERDAELATCFAKVGVLSHRGLARVRVEPIEDRWTAPAGP